MDFSSFTTKAFVDCYVVYGLPEKRDIRSIKHAATPKILVVKLCSVQNKHTQAQVKRAVTSMLNNAGCSLHSLIIEFADHSFIYGNDVPVIANGIRYYKSRSRFSCYSIEYPVYKVNPC